MFSILCECPIYLLERKQGLVLLSLNHTFSLIDVKLIKLLFFTIQEDRQLRASSKRKITQRKFKISKISPSAGNIVIVLYRCGDDYKVQMYLNEHQVPVPACRRTGDQLLCPLNRVVSYYQDFVRGSPTECDFDAICDNQWHFCSVLLVYINLLNTRRSCSWLI